MNSAIRNGAIALAAALLAVPAAVTAYEDEAKGHEELAQAMKGAKVSLERGLSAAGAHAGVPISAKYEVEDGKLQLSVYTMKGEGFSEVIVDHASGKVSKTEPITSGEDLAEAKEQKEAMARAKRSLKTATDDAAKHHSGFRAVSVIPRLEGGRPVATVTLFKGDEWKTVSVKLDGGK